MSAKLVSVQSVKGHDARPKHDAWGFFGRQGVTDQPVTYSKLTDLANERQSALLPARMKNPARASAPEPRRSEPIERLTDAVNHLAEEVRVARDVMDEIREDLGWVTRNGIPCHPTIHTQLIRMARDPLASDAHARLEFRRFSHGAPDAPTQAPDTLHELVSEIAEVITGTGQEQVNLLISALDDLRTKLFEAIKSAPQEPNAEATAPSAPQPCPPPSPSRPTKQRQLF